ncbi:TLD domain-containing protein 2 [Zancudomyces culisetae]|uniref:TLD domain-containing protein 2 n=1 Tax=Zancudomyces culisetae TaxID=1213189 RepID=A0A1R1PJY8_ZANCU|nr:TLD domain-containing protein 2 [Zancudomyces culisetae]|eukprot:OMH81290.1 TLD domain-containing protein 2 [Zancudomyces culisetae]
MSQTKSGECGQHERCRVRTFRRTRTSDVSTSDVELVGRNKDVEPVITKEIADQIFGAFINESLKISPNFYGNGTWEGCFGLWFQSDLLNGRSTTCPTFNNEALCIQDGGGVTDAKFSIKSLELWAL